MRRLAVLVASAAALIAAAPAAAQSGRTDDATKRVVLLSGSEMGTIDCNSLWVPAIDHLTKMRFRIKGVDQKFSGGFVTVSNNDSDHNCDVTLGKGEQMDLAAQAKVFAAWLEKEGRPVDIVAFGTGGLVARMALGYQGSPDWPGPLPVEDVVTVGTPHLGSRAIAAACPTRPSCQELDTDTGVGQGLINLLAQPRFQNPLGDWTVIGSAGDELVKPESAMGMDADHETTYSDAKLTHAKLLKDLLSTRNATVTYKHRDTEIIEWRKAPHLVERIGLNLVYGSAGNDSAPTTQTGCTGYSEIPGGPTVVRFPGMVGWKGTHDMSYVKNGIMEAYADCLKKVYASKELTSDGPVRVNGLDLTPRPGSVITIDPTKRSIKGDHVNLSIPSQYFGALPVPLRQDAEISWTLPREAGKLEGNDLDGFTLSGAGKIAGLKLKGSAKLTFIQGGVQLDTNLQLPGLFTTDMPTGKAYVEKPQCSDGLDNDNDGKTDTADSNCDTPQDNYEDGADNPGFTVSIKSDNLKGLFLDKISGTVEGNIRLGKLELPAASFSYSLPDNAWTASVTAVLPIPNAPKLKIEGGLKDGQLSKFSAEVSGLNAGPLPANLYLQRVKVGWVREPFEIQFGAGISWDRRYTFPNYRDVRRGRGRRRHLLHRYQPQGDGQAAAVRDRVGQRVCRLEVRQRRDAEHGHRALDVDQQGLRQDQGQPQGDASGHVHGGDRQDRRGPAGHRRRVLRGLAGVLRLQARAAEDVPGRGVGARVDQEGPDGVHRLRAGRSGRLGGGDRLRHPLRGRRRRQDGRDRGRDDGLLRRRELAQAAGERLAGGWRAERVRGCGRARRGDRRRG